MRHVFAVGKIEPSRSIMPEMGFCTGCAHTVVVLNARDWPEPFNLRTGECSRCHSTISVYPDLPSGPSGAAA